MGHVEGEVIRLDFFLSSENEWTSHGRKLD